MIRRPDSSSRASTTSSSELELALTRTSIPNALPTVAARLARSCPPVRELGQARLDYRLDPWRHVRWSVGEPGACPLDHEEGVTLGLAKDRLTPLLAKLRDRRRSRPGRRSPPHRVLPSSSWTAWSAASPLEEQLLCRMVRMKLLGPHGGEDQRSAPTNSSGRKYRSQSIVSSSHHWRSSMIRRRGDSPASTARETPSSRRVRCALSVSGRGEGRSGRSCRSSGTRRDSSTSQRSPSRRRASGDRLRAQELSERRVGESGSRRIALAGGDRITLARDPALELLSQARLANAGLAR